MLSSNLESRPTKVCSMCGEEKPLIDYFKKKKSSNALRSDCKPCVAKRHKAWRSAVPGRDRKRFLKRAYGITPEQYTEMLDLQDGKCAANGCDSSTSRGGVLYIDHCHKTGKVRGLLCHNCNTALGNVRDKISNLNGLVAYLEKNKE